MRLEIFSIIITFTSHPLMSESTSCLLSSKTAEIVVSCPESLTEMTKRAQVKNCEKQSRTHNCTGTKPYEYHCVINELEDAFVEVCAEKKFINIGTCAEYNIYGKVIQPHNRLNCTNGNPPCPIRYESTDAYRYKYCYDAVRKNANRSTPESTTIENSTSSTQLATNGRYISLTELTTLKSNHSTRQDNATSNRDKENSTSHLAAIAVLPIIIILLLLFIFKYRTKIPYIRDYFQGQEEGSGQRDIEEPGDLVENAGLALLHEGGNNLRYGNIEEPGDLVENIEEPGDLIENAGSALLHEGGNNSRYGNIEEPRDPVENAGSSLLHEGGNYSGNENIKEPRDPVENAGSTLLYERKNNSRHESLALLHEGGNYSRNGKERKTCRKENYEDEIKSAQTLLELMSMKGINFAEKLAEKQAQAETFMNGNEQMRHTYVETRMLKACRDSLNLNGIAILIGQQGCGKTLTAVHIMCSAQYKEWKKLMFTSWEDLLTIKVEDNSLVYIDNILDGFIYLDIVQKWFNSLCHFCFEQREKDVHLLITCKQNVIEEALEHIKAEAVPDTILLKADSFPLMNDEKLEILKSQFKIAKELKKIDNPNLESKFTFLEYTEFDIGFPMCAHMYAFETQACAKSEAIFKSPRDYVMRHIQNEITQDRTNDVMALFLFLLFYTNSSHAKIMREVDIRYGGKCQKYLEGLVSKEFLENKKLKFQNLYERAKNLKDTILVEYSSMFEFKHQIYKEGVVDYFFREDAIFAIEYFPLDILRSYEFRDAASIIWTHITMRLMKELKNIRKISMDEYEVKERNIAEVFSCKIFECRAFEKEFSMEFEKTLKEDYALQECLFNRKLHLSFWIGRYHLSTLLKTIMDLVDQFSEYQFYQALFGECCMKDKKHSVYLTSHMDLHTLKERVFGFKTSSGKSIKHLILQSDKLDCDAHNTLVKLLKDPADKHVLQFNELLECSLKELSCSRLLCILEILQGQNNLPTECIKNLISETIKQMNLCDYNECLELEMLVRICILLVHYDIQVLSAGAGICPDVNTKFDTVKKLLSGPEITISEKTNLIKLCIANCQRKLNLPNYTPTNRHIPCIHNTNLEFEEAVKAAIHLQEKAGYRKHTF